MTIVEIGKMNDEQAREYLENIRWPNDPVCPHCQGTNVTRLKGEAHRPGMIQCNAKECRGQFTVTVGGVMESSHIPLVKWAMGFHMLSSSKKGMSALQLQRNLGLGSYRTAWFMCHRIRCAMEGQPVQQKMTGVVESDETYIGGKPKRNSGKRGRGTKKQPVMVLVQRDGAAVSMPVPNVTIKTVRRELNLHVSKSAILMTDEHSAYIKPGQRFKEHDTVNHGTDEYARRRDDGLVVHVNSCESFFALMKRGHHGIYHSWSKKHMHRYCSEFGFRWTHRKTTDTERTEVAIQQAEGKRLLYKNPCEKSA
ncbi:MAG: IS1595 family transposase [Planctomycetia bacterium]|nr:IS1595 family transposase [Planctomycetia bacterium]